MPQRSIIPTILENWPIYLANHRRDPRRYPMTTAGVARGIGVERVHLYKNDARIKAIRRQMATLEKEQKYGHLKMPSAAPNDSANSEIANERERLDVDEFLTRLQAGGPIGLSDDGLARQISQQVRRATDTMARYQSQWRRSEDVLEEAPLALHDLEVVIGLLSKQVQHLMPLVAERHRREKMHQEKEDGDSGF